MTEYVAPHSCAASSAISANTPSGAVAGSQEYTAMAKLYASEVAVRATEKGVQIFGGDPDHIRAGPAPSRDDDQLPGGEGADRA